MLFAFCCIVSMATIHNVASYYRVYAYTEAVSFGNVFMPLDFTCGWETMICRRASRYTTVYKKHYIVLTIPVLEVKIHPKIWGISQITNYKSINQYCN